MKFIQITPGSIWLFASGLALVAALALAAAFAWNEAEEMSSLVGSGALQFMIFAIMSLASRINWYANGGRRRKDIAVAGILAISGVGIFQPVSSASEVDLAGQTLLLAILILLCDACLEAYEAIFPKTEGTRP